MKRIAIVIAVVGALSLAPRAAQAWEAPGQHPAPPIVLEMVAQARSFWTDRNVVSCPRGITVWQAPRLVTSEEDWGLGDGATCEIWVSDSLVAAITSSYAGDLLMACTAITHETGHALGLGHTPTGVMAGKGTTAPWPFAWSPYFCLTWTQRTVAAKDASAPRRDRARYARYARAFRHMVLYGN